MSLVKVTSKERNGKPYAKDMLVDINRITDPVIENSGADSIINLGETPNLHKHVNQGNNINQYIIDEDLLTFTALKSKEMFIGSVVSREDRVPVALTMTFIVKNVVGKIVEHPSGSEFLYEEEGGSVPVKYILSETIAAIAALLV